MPAANFLRIFKDNNHYSDYNKLHYMDSLARIAADYVFSDRLADGDCPVSLGYDYISLYDFMTLTVFIIMESVKDFGDTTIKEWLNTYEPDTFRPKPAVLYSKTGGLYINNGGWELEVALLWTAFVYVSFRYNTEYDKKWYDAQGKLGRLMFEASRLEKRWYKKTAIVNKLDEACQAMLAHIRKTYAQLAQSATKEEEAPKEVPAADSSGKDARIKELEAELKSRDDKIAEKDTKIASLQQLLEQREFRSTKPEDATLKEEIARLKHFREDMLVELLRASFYVEDDARRFVKEIDNGMDGDGVAEVARRYYLDNKIIKSKRGRSIWEILHAAKLYDKVEQSWTREMRKAD